MGYFPSGTGVPPWKGPGTSHWGTTLERTWDQWKYYGMEMGYPLGKEMGPVEVLWDGEGLPPPRKEMGPVEVLWGGEGYLPPESKWDQ